MPAKKKAKKSPSPKPPQPPKKAPPKPKSLSLEASYVEDGWTVVPPGEWKDEYVYSTGKVVIPSYDRVKQLEARVAAIEACLVSKGLVGK